MAEPLEARIVIVRGQRSDLLAEIKVYEPRNGKINDWGLRAGPMQSDIDAKVREIKKQLERAGHRVSVIER